MDTPAPRYQRLTRNHMGAGTYSSLWLGPDHLLLITTTGYTEEYRRFYFRDIQVLYIKPTRWRTYWSAIIGVPTFLFALFILLITDGSWGVMLFLTGPMLVWLGVHCALGPCCRSYLATAVQTTPLSPLSRLRKARAVVAQLRPLILEAQANLAAPPPTPDTPAATAAGEATTVASAPSAQPVLPATAAPASGAETVAPTSPTPPPAA